MTVEKAYFVQSKTEVLKLVEKGVSDKLLKTPCSSFVFGRQTFLKKPSVENNISRGFRVP